MKIIYIRFVYCSLGTLRSMWLCCIKNMQLLMHCSWKTTVSALSATWWVCIFILMLGCLTLSCYSTWRDSVRHLQLFSAAAFDDCFIHQFSSGTQSWVCLNIITISIQIQPGDAVRWTRYLLSISIRQPFLKCPNRGMEQQRCIFRRFSQEEIQCVAVILWCINSHLSVEIEPIASNNARWYLRALGWFELLITDHNSSSWNALSETLSEIFDVL